MVCHQLLIGCLRRRLTSASVAKADDGKVLPEEPDSEHEGHHWHQIDPTLVNFIANLAGETLKIFLIITAVSMIGIHTTSFIAVFTASTFAITLALKGQLSNFAAGVMIIMFRSFKFRDYVEIAGLEGKVMDVGIFYTQLSDGNKTHLIPNGNIGNS